MSVAKLVYLLTDHRYVDPEHIDWYTQQILDEDELLSKALSKHNIMTQRVDWADTTVDWLAGHAAVVRTTWDYFHRFSEFDLWLNEVSKKIRLINPASLLRWNLDKHYLLDLQERGFPIVPSLIIEQGDERSLVEIHQASGWDEVILKPCVSGGARHTYRITADELERHEPTYTELIKEESMMLQPFQASILERGEVSHMVFGGQYTHSVLKRGKGDDFRIQDDFGGTTHHYEASPEERQLAEAVFNSCEPCPAYGRLDLMWDDSDAVMISELEIIEPELWLRTKPSAAITMADAIAAQLENN